MAYPVVVLFCVFCVPTPATHLQLVQAIIKEALIKPIRV